MINFRKNRIEISAKTKALTKPTMKKGITSEVMEPQFLSKEKKLTPAMIGTAIMKVKSAAVRCFIPSRTPPEIVEPERENPGHMDKHWTRPTMNACLYVI
ncbi:hypothetical protein D3C71_1522570 [compost metagenome]